MTGEEDGRPSAAAATDVRAPLEAVELQTPRGLFGGTLADVSGGERGRRELGGHDTRAKSAQIQQIPKVCLRQGRVDALRDLTQVNESTAADSPVFFFLPFPFFFFFSSLLTTVRGDRHGGGSSPRVLFTLPRSGRRQGAAATAAAGTGWREGRRKSRRCLINYPTKRCRAD